VDTSDLADGEHGALDAAEHDSLLLRELVGKVGGTVVVGAWLEDQDDRKASRLERPEPPAVVGPEVVAVGLGAGRAVDAALAISPRLGTGRRERS
jgi:hypothetical protein